jgi:GTPase SAR1 family protein
LQIFLIRNKNTFVEDYDPTLEDSYRQRSVSLSVYFLNLNRKRQVVDDETLLYEIFDTATPYDQAVRSAILRKVDGCIFVYSITSKSSFEAIPTHIENVLSSKDIDKVPMVLVWITLHLCLISTKLREAT